MTDLWTRERVERGVRELLRYGNKAQRTRLVGQVAAALLAMAECDHVKLRADGCYVLYGREICEKCGGTGLNQATVARGFAALKGAG